ncbi:unnamed protein product [Cyprideis torosa]|uniref:Mediator of RNA polymerase II transcription subunit 22 n=1 Tax=Cyprideis torosa TaxID=163714 RepID=A0A7R8W3N4_9CRUS|nr:unnamed protein product [Cyprideis torosa]CAG0883188.1 unnamed protein product [Cyprideis torosa]
MSGAPTAAPQQRAVISQSKEALLKSYSKRLKDDVKSILDNFTEIIKLGRIEDETQVNRHTQLEQDGLEMQVRAANIVRATESLNKLVADLKQYLILNDFPSVNDAIAQNTKVSRGQSEEIDTKLKALRDDLAVDLFDMEDEYYSSIYK